MKLIEIKKIEGSIILKSGMHIGSGDTEMHIGGTDSPVIKHPHTLEPYIPGSSLKGKVRSLLEMQSGLMVLTQGDVVSFNTLTKIKDYGEKKVSCENILKIFGASGSDKGDDQIIGPSRVSFSDCYLDKEWLEKVKKERLSLTEVKSENVINRIKGTAEHPRFIERVPEGTEFSFLLTFKVFENDDEELFNYLFKGLKLLEMDTIGGSGSRGYGRIKFDFIDKGIQSQFKSLNPFNDMKK